MEEEGGPNERPKKGVHIRKKDEPPPPPSDVDKNKTRGSIVVSRRATVESLLKGKVDPPTEGDAQEARTFTDQNDEKAALEERAAAGSRAIGAADPSEPKITAEEGGRDTKQQGPEPEIIRETSLLTESQKLRQMAQETGNTASDAKGTESPNETGQVGEQDKSGENSGSELDAWSSVLVGKSDHPEGTESIENKPPSGVKSGAELGDEAPQNEDKTLKEADGVTQDGENVAGKGVPGEDVTGKEVTNEKDIAGKEAVKTDELLEQKPSSREKKEVQGEAEYGRKKPIDDQKGFTSSKRNVELPIMLERSKPSENFIGTNRKAMVRSGVLIIKEKEDACYDVRFAVPEKILAYSVGAKVSGRFSTLTAEMEGDSKSNKKTSESAKTSVWSTQTGSQKMSTASTRGSVRNMATNTETAPQHTPTTSEPMDYYRQYYNPQVVPWPANTPGYYSSMGNYTYNGPYNSNNPNNPPNNCNPNK